MGSSATLCILPLSRPSLASRLILQVLLRARALCGGVSVVRISVWGCARAPVQRRNTTDEQVLHDPCNDEES